MMGDKRLLFIVKSLHCVVGAEEDLTSSEVEGLKQIVENVILDERESHAQVK